MSSSGPCRRHSAQLELRLRYDFRSDTLGRRDAQRKYTPSTNLIQMGLTQFDRGKLSNEGAEHLWWPTTKRRSQPRSARLVSSRWSWSKNATPAPRDRQREFLHRHRPETCSIRRGAKRCRWCISSRAPRIIFPRTAVGMQPMPESLALGTSEHQFAASIGIDARCLACDWVGCDLPRIRWCSWTQGSRSAM